ncbi:SGNH/GDSL hydrolase family protein, partial [Streptococcus pyogenes]
AAQPFLHVLKYGKFEFASTPGTTPGEATASPRGLKRLAIFGDSVTGNNSSSGSRERLKDNGYLPWALRFCQQRYFFPQAWNFGVGGDNTAD